MIYRERAERSVFRPSSRRPTVGFRDQPAPLARVALAATLVLYGLLLDAGASDKDAASGDKWRMRKDAVIAVPAAQTKFSPADRAAFVAVKAQGASRSMDTRIAQAPPGAVSYGVINVEFDSAASCNRFNVRGATALTRFDRFADLFIPWDQAETLWDAIAAAPGVVWIEPAGSAEAPPPPKVVTAPRSRQVADKIVRGGVAGLTGKGVILAVVDTGVDFRNPDFITYDSDGNPTSRLLYLWDTLSDAFDARHLGSKPPLSYPNGAAIGTLYTREQLTADLRSAVPRIPATDLKGHGTACAGVAAGSGNNDRKKRNYVVGVAPEADIIAVRVGGKPGVLGLENTFLLGAICGWLDAVAGTKPLIVSCSFGSHYGGHDSARVIERQLDARFPLDRRSRAIVISAGNEGRDAIHAEVDFKDVNQPGRLLWDSGKGGQLDIFLDNPDLDLIKVSPAGDTTLKFEGSGVSPITKQGILTFRIAAGPGGLYLYNTSGTPMRADSYIHGGFFDATVASFGKQVGTPGTATHAITVGSYDWNDEFDASGQIVSVQDFCDTEAPLIIGALSCYSSPGYSRNGTIKPDVVAPGEVYYASYAKLADRQGVAAYMVDSSGNYQLFNGTSAAAPYVAGVVALMMQKKPTVTLDEIKGLLQRSASRDRRTGAVPNTRWGYGKLDFAAVERIIQALN